MPVRPNLTRIIPFTRARRMLPLLFCLAMATTVVAVETTDTSSDRLGTRPAGVGLDVGASLPAVSAVGLDGQPVALQALHKTSGLVLVFYRGGWCPYCNFQIRELRKSFSAFEKRGYTPVAISVDSVSDANKTKATHEIPFPVLSDTSREAHKAFNVLNGKAAGIAVPSIFIVDREGKIRWTHVDPDYSVRPSAVQLLAVLDWLAGG